MEMNQRILIVDDNRAIHQDFRKVLKAESISELTQLEEALFGDTRQRTGNVAGLAGMNQSPTFELDSAYQGEEGVEMVHRAQMEGRPYALAFVDMRMPPGWDGLQTVERMFACDPRIQVVICTAYSDSSWLEIQERFGPTDRLLILKKPFDLAEVCQLACTLTRKWYLTEQAHYDHLTGLPNRSLLSELFQQGVDYARSNEGMLGFFYIDLDQFKVINDSFGHSAGDAVLEEVARRLKGCVGKTESLARVGGDEFAFLMNLKTTEEASHLATKLLDTFAQAIDAGGHNVYSSASIGISIFPQDGGSLDAISHKADAAMYESKRDSPMDSSFRFYNAEITDRARVQLKMRTRLHGAVEKNELVLHYQPVYSLLDGRMTGAEALVRWNDSLQGLVYPGAFIPAAEDHGYIAKIDKWVLGQAFKQARQWEREGGNPFRVAVNISGRLFSDSDLIPTIVDMLARTGANPALLDVELTETVLVCDLNKAVGTMKALGDLGLRVSIDDFGTGYSSLNYLANLPFNTLKIDRSFLQGLGKNRRHLLVLESTVGLAHKLGTAVIAEGIEDADQLNAVRSAGCDEAQGYLLGMPGLPEQLDRSKSLFDGRDIRMSADLTSLSVFTGVTHGLAPMSVGSIQTESQMALSAGEERTDKIHSAVAGPPKPEGLRI